MPEIWPFHAVPVLRCQKLKPTKKLLSVNFESGPNWAQNPAKASKTCPKTFFQAYLGPKHKTFFIKKKNKNWAVPDFQGQKTYTKKPKFFAPGIGKNRKNRDFHDFCW